MKEFKINKNDSGQRVDKFILKTVPKLPKTLLYKYIRLKRIKVNKKRCEISQVLAENDMVEMYINDEFFEIKKNTEFLTINSSLNIIYEDENILIVNKPAGTDVHRGSENNKETLIDIIKSYLYQKNEYNPDEENSFSPAICNRLDRNTTGLVIAAKNAQSLREINERIRSREIVKKYLCICCGIISKNEFIKTDYLKKCQHNRVEIISNPVQGYKKIITGCKVISRKNNFTLAEINLITGRTHQIRAHLAYLGYPILGDGKYGSVTVNKRMGIFHQQLCAYSLEFKLNSGGILDYLNGKIFKVPDTRFWLNIFRQNISPFI